jgi:photosynthetic reaction center cytochrome c subunit
MNKKTLATVALAFLTTLGLRAQQGPPPPPPPAAGQLAPQYYKNIKILTKVPADQLRTQMEYFTASLGVQCTFCHVQNQFDSDEKPQKDRARKMMQMVDRFNANSANDITVNCATCHHGRTPPERTPALAVEMTPAEASAFAAARAARGGGPGGPGRQGPGMSGPGNGGRGRGAAAVPQPKPTETVDMVVDKYVQALGGRAALEQAKSRVLEGTQTTRDLQTQPIRIQETSTGEYRVDVNTQPNPVVRAFDGKKAWVAGQGPNARELEGVQAAQIARPTDFGLALNLRTKYKSLAVHGYGSIAGTGTITLEGDPAPEIGETLEFDRQSGLLLRRSIQTRTAYGNLAEQVDYSDYRDVAGVKVPYQVRYTTWQQVTTEKFSDVKINAPIDEAVFSKK